MWRHLERGSSPIDWCEENYSFSPHIAEFINTTSNVLFLVMPPFLMLLHRDYTKHCGHGQYDGDWFILSVVENKSIFWTVMQYIPVPVSCFLPFVLIFFHGNRAEILCGLFCIYCILHAKYPITDITTPHAAMHQFPEMLNCLAIVQEFITPHMSSVVVNLVSSAGLGWYARSSFHLNYRSMITRTDGHYCTTGRL